MCWNCVAGIPPGLATVRPGDAHRDGGMEGARPYRRSIRGMTSPANSSSERSASASAMLPNIM